MQPCMYKKLKDPEKYGSWTRRIKRLWRHLMCRLKLCEGAGKCGCVCHTGHWFCCGEGNSKKKS